MAFNVTILQLDDETGNALVEFEDTSSNTIVKMGVYIPEEFIDEASILDFLVTLWPYADFIQRGKPPADRHKEPKKIVGVKKNITGRVQQGQP